MGTYTDDNPNALNTSGYQTVFYDGFNGSALDRGAWPAVYGGPSNGNYTYSAADVSVGNGELFVSATNHDGIWTAGGVNQSWSGSHTYGLFEVRARVDAGEGTGPGILLWPTDNNWPPETDLLEAPGASKSTVYLTNHWAGDYASTAFNVDATQWHTYALDWQPDHMTYSIDGQAMFTIRDHVPQTAMSLGFMEYVAFPGDTWYGGAPSAGSGAQLGLHVDWVNILEPAGSGASVTAPATPATPAAPADGTDWNAVAAAVLANHALTGTWDLGATQAPAAIDWGAVAADVNANLAATGHWFV